jgi:cytoskeletal protein CcmA (bactofilin family)
MWTKQTDVPGVSPTQAPASPAPAPSSGVKPSMRPLSPAVRNVACLGASLEIYGNISGKEDLQIDGKVEGTISLPGHRLTVGSTAHLTSEIVSREVVVCGKVTGNLRAQDRVEIKKDGSVVGDITTARISIEDGAHFKGRIEIDRANAPASADLADVGYPVVTAAV